MTQFQWARKDPVRYISKYLAKADQYRMPKGIRMYGRGGQEPETRRQIRFCLLPSYVKKSFSESADVIRAAGGGWVDRSSGEWVPAIGIVIDWSS